MTPRVRKFVLTAHIISSVGWFGAVAGFLALAIAGLTSRDVQIMRAAYLSMELVGWFVIVPLDVASLLTGLVQSLGTTWGLFRHYWILVKFLLTIGATILLLLHMQAVSRVAGIAAGTPSGAAFGALQIQLLVDASLALLVLLAATILSVYKPWGRTRYGQRKQQEQLATAGLSSHLDDIGMESAAGISWVQVLGIIGLVLLIIALHLTGIVGNH